MANIASFTQRLYIRDEGLLHQIEGQHGRSVALFRGEPVDIQGLHILPTVGPGLLGLVNCGRLPEALVPHSVKQSLVVFSPMPWRFSLLGSSLWLSNENLSHLY